MLMAEVCGCAVMGAATILMCIATGFPGRARRSYGREGESQNKGRNRSAMRDTNTIAIVMIAGIPHA